MTAGLFAAALRHDRVVVLGGLALAVALAWTYLLLGAGVEMGTMDMGGGRTMAMAPEWSLSYGIVVFAMWVVMMVAMMLPSAAPVTLLVASIARRRREAGTAVGFTVVPFIVGYLAVWFAFAATATVCQWMLDEAGLLSPTMALANIAAAGTVLIAAGIYQWTPLKAACLRNCRSPFDFLLNQWSDSTFGAFLSGTNHGAYCFGCCWMLMVLLFVGGMMNLTWIAGIALLVLIEKTLPWSGWTERVTGAILVAWGALTLAMAA